MGFWLLKRHAVPRPPQPHQPASGRDATRSSKQRVVTTTSAEHDDNEDGDVRHYHRSHHHQQQQQQHKQTRRFLFPWQRRQQKAAPPPKSWSQSESDEELSPDNSSGYNNNNIRHGKNVNVEGRRPFLRNSQRLRNSQDFDDEDEVEGEDADDQVNDPRYRLEPPLKGSASMTSYAAASADVTKSFTLSTSSQSTIETLQNGSRESQQNHSQQQTRSKLYMPMDSHAGGSNADAAYQTRIIHPNIHKRDIFIDTSRTPDAYQQQQHRNTINNNSNAVFNNGKQQHVSYQNARPDPDTILDVLGETTTRHTNHVKRPDPIEDMKFPTPKSYYSPCSFTSPRTTTSFNLPSYSVTGSMVYNAREQHGMESRAMQPARASKSPFKPTAVPSNSILASMLFRTSQLDDQPQSEQQHGKARNPHHHQRLPPSYGAAARKEEERQSEASSPHSEVEDENEEEEEEEEVEEELEETDAVEVNISDNQLRLDPDGRMNSVRRLDTVDDRQGHVYQEPEEEFDPRQYYYHPDEFINVPDDIIHPQGSGISSVSSVTDMWATVVDHHWNHANSRMIDLLETAMQEKFPASSSNGRQQQQPSNNTTKRQQAAMPTPHRNRYQPPQQSQQQNRASNQQQRQASTNNNNNRNGKSNHQITKNSSNNNNNSKLYEA